MTVAALRNGCGSHTGIHSSVTKNVEVRAIFEDLASDCPSTYDNLCPDQLPPEVKTLIQKEDLLYGKYIVESEFYMSRIRQKVYSMNWATKDSTISGSEMVRILCTTPGVGEISCFVWLAFIGTPRRFHNAKAVAAYCDLAPSLKISAGKVTNAKKHGGSGSSCHSGKQRRSHHTRTFRSLRSLGLPHGQVQRQVKKAINAVGYKLCTAMYYMMMSGTEFSYDNYKIMQQASIFDIPVDELPILNPDFKRYVRILHDNNIHTTADMAKAYLFCSLGGVKGLERKFFVTIQDFLQRQHHYKVEYKKLHPTENVIEITQGG